MFKAIALAVIGILSTASAAVLEIPMENWLQATPKSSSIKMQLQGATHKLTSTASRVKWSECASQRLYDVATGTAKPQPPIVGDFVSLNLDVIFNDDAFVIGNYIYVLFTPEGSTDPITLYAQDFDS